jgi:hypothetical protein
MVDMKKAAMEGQAAGLYMNTATAGSNVDTSRSRARQRIPDQELHHHLTRAVQRKFANMAFTPH